MLALAVLAAVAFVPPDTLLIKEWKVPYADSRPRDPAVAPDGRIWFVGQVGNYVGLLDPATGAFKKYDLPKGVLPHSIIVDPAGTPWISGNGNATLGRLDAATGAVKFFPMPDAAAADPHTMVFDKAGDIWFTVQNGNFVGKLTVKTGKVQLVKPSTAGARPYGILLDREGHPWFDLFGSNRMGTIDPATMVMKEIVLPDAKSRPRRIAITPDGRIWWGDYTQGRLGAITPSTGKIEQFDMPGGRASLPYALTTDGNGRLWYVETGSQPNKFVGFDPATKQFFGATAVPSGGGTVRNMVYDRATHQIWFGTDVNTIGRATVPVAGPRAKEVSLR